MVVPKYHRWNLDGLSKEDRIAVMRTTLLPAIVELSNGTPLTEMADRNPWTLELFSGAASHQVDTAYRTSPNDMTIVLSKYADTLFGTIVTVSFQRRLNEELVNQYR